MALECRISRRGWHEAGGYHMSRCLDVAGAYVMESVREHMEVRVEGRG